MVSPCTAFRLGDCWQWIERLRRQLVNVEASMGTLRKGDSPASKLYMIKKRCEAMVVRVVGVQQRVRIT